MAKDMVCKVGAGIRQGAGRNEGQDIVGARVLFAHPYAFKAAAPRLHPPVPPKRPSAYRGKLTTP